MKKINDFLSSASDDGRKEEKPSRGSSRAAVSSDNIYLYLPVVKGSVCEAFASTPSVHSLHALFWLLLLWHRK